jgi:hypothetical protein
LLTPRQYYLGGGTAVALHLGHRRSVDLDWFTTALIADPLLLAQDLRDSGVPFVTRSAEHGTLHGSVARVRVSLLTYQYPLLANTVAWSYGRCELAAVADLAAMKLAAVAQRGAKKDFVDVFALGTRRASLAQMLDWYRQKYATQEIFHLLYSLIYFDDADRERLPRMLWRTTWRAVKKAIQEWVRDVTT